MLKVCFHTLGCKVNQYETEEMIELFEKNGFEITEAPENADVLVVNSCTVTAQSVRKTRQIFRKMKASSPNAVTVLTGCAIQAEPELLMKELPDADIFLGNKQNDRITDAVKEFLNNRTQLNLHEHHKSGEEIRSTGISRFEGHTRAFLKIQDGCDRFCSYCLIPTARGRSRSKSLDAIDRELNALNESGYKEIVFVGINLSDYGKNSPYSLPDALMLAEKYDGIKRVRLGSLEPDHITEEMTERLAKVKKLCPQFHISVQSGCDGILKRMNRHYTAAEYEELVKRLRSTFKDATITTDILVGFPGETEEDFQTTVDFAERIRFEKIHVFPYSKRDNTPAAKMEQLTNSVKENRSRHLIATAEKIRNDYLSEQIGKTVTVLFETDGSDRSEGFTENYTPVMIKDTVKRCGKIMDVKIIGVENDYCIGEEIR